jgi:hypothetical protein
MLPTPKAVPRYMEWEFAELARMDMNKLKEEGEALLAEYKLAGKMNFTYPSNSVSAISSAWKPFSVSNIVNSTVAPCLSVL